MRRDPSLQVTIKTASPGPVEMSLQLRAVAALPQDLGPVPSTHLVVLVTCNYTSRESDTLSRHQAPTCIEALTYRHKVTINLFLKIYYVYSVLPACLPACQKSAPGFIIG